MSLFLRKECQTLLDEVNLQNYHIQINESSKCLEIVGECGQVLTTIMGIRLSRMAPTKDEIKLALELFDNFLAKHAVSFKQFIEAKFTADNAVIPKSVKGLKNIKVSKDYQGDHTLTFYAKNYTEEAIRINSKGNIHIPRININLVKNPNATLQYALTDEEVTAIKTWIEATTAFNKAMEEKEKILSKLSSCEI